jgi:predicted enzyme related to lactoylglutathione lyase
MQTAQKKTGFERSTPILRVADMQASVRYYVEMLGFCNAPWRNGDFTSVNRDRAGIYLSRGGQGQPGTWVWVGVEDVQVPHEEYKSSGAKIRHAPLNFPWACEMTVDDPDGHVLRFGSESLSDRPFDEWID